MVDARDLDDVVDVVHDVLHVRGRGRELLIDLVERGAHGGPLLVCHFARRLHGRTQGRYGGVALRVLRHITKIG